MKILSKEIAQQKSPFLKDALHIFVLVSLGLAQPLFDLLSRNVEFFIARHSAKIDIILLVLILSLLVPALFVLAEWLVGFAGLRLRRYFHYFLVAALVVIILLPAIKRVEGLPGIVLIIIAAVIGGLFTAAYARSNVMRSSLSVVSPAILILPGLFLFNSPVSKFLFSREGGPVVYAEVNASTPVVFLILDELPITSLMDEDRRIDPVRYPNFAALAKESTWYRNTTTVADSTLHAVPAVISGSYPDPTRLAFADDHPNNIFTLLGASYEMNVFESSTMICPSYLCKSKIPRQGLTERLGTMLDDLKIVYLHIILPEDLAIGLPSVTRTWNAFGGNGAAPPSSDVDREDLRRQQVRAAPKSRSNSFARFVESITLTDRPSLNFLHINLPHVSWEYLPSGKRYSLNAREIRGLIRRGKWGDNDWLITQGFQRHLLQLSFVDKLLGDLVSKLKAIGVYERSLLVITADHGVSFRPNGKRRAVTEENYQDIMPVPLFIKVPYQRDGVISDRNVETVDILPTIADLLKIKLPWQPDGQSAVDDSLAERTRKVVFYEHGKKQYIFAPDISSKYDTLKKKIDIFGTGAAAKLFEIGPHKSLLGRNLQEVSVAGDARGEVELGTAYMYETVDPESSFVPAQITGYLHMPGDDKASANLAVAVNGTIRAVTQTYVSERKENKFAAIVPESSFRAGQNDIKLFAVEKLAEGVILLPLPTQFELIKYSLHPANEGPVETIISSKGTQIRVVPNAVSGYIASAKVYNGTMTISGWAADITHSQPPEVIVIFVNGDSVFSGKTNLNRPDIAKTFTDHAMGRIGFKFRLPSSRIMDTPNPVVRVFAVSKEGVASELHYK